MTEQCVSISALEFKRLSVDELLDATGVNIGDSSAQKLIELLQQSTRIESVGLDPSFSSAKEMQEIIHAVCHSRVKYFYAYGQWLESCIPIFANCICTIEPKNQHLEGLSLTACSLTEKNGIMLAQALPQSNIRMLIIDNNSLGPSGGMAFAEVLAANKCRLEDLDIGDNEFDEEAVGALGRALASNTVLKILELRDCPIGIEGAMGLAYGLKRNSTLKTLDLAGPVGKRQTDLLPLFMEGVAKSKGLRNLHLSQWYFGGKDEAKQLADALATNKSLRELDVSDVHLADLDTICKGLQSNFTLRQVDLSYNECNALSVYSLTTTNLLEVLMEDSYNVLPSDLAMTCVNKALGENRMRHEERIQRLHTIINYRRSFQAWRDRSRIFISAREGRVMELKVRLLWGKLAGGLSLKGFCDGQLMTPLKAAKKRGHQECVDLIQAADLT